ncbi:hypothetical protein BHE74_00019141 [Ensete ventricosum]|nr:hypothetical protein BHE74_00019141 [Ensete ventricosum]
MSLFPISPAAALLSSITVASHLIRRPPPCSPQSLPPATSSAGRFLALLPPSLPRRIPLPQPSQDPAASSSQPPSPLLLNNNRRHFQPAIPLLGRCSNRALLTFLPRFLAGPRCSPAAAALVRPRCLLLFLAASAAAKPFFTATKPSLPFLHSAASSSAGHLCSSPPCHRHRPSLLLHYFPSASHPIFPCDPRKPPPPLLLPCLSSLLPLP